MVSLSMLLLPLHLQSLEKMNKRRDLQQQLMEAKLQQADALLADAQEKHKREKEYVSRIGRGRKWDGKEIRKARNKLG